MKYFIINGLVEEDQLNGYLTSPDLTPLDYFYWGYLKSKVFETKPADIDELRARIIDISNLITPEILHNVQGSIYIRMAHCQVLQ